MIHVIIIIINISYQKVSLFSARILGIGHSVVQHLLSASFLKNFA